MNPFYLIGFASCMIREFNPDLATSVSSSAKREPTFQIYCSKFKYTSYISPWLNTDNACLS